MLTAFWLLLIHPSRAFDGHNKDIFETVHGRPEQTGPCKYETLLKMDTNILKQLFISYIPRKSGENPLVVLFLM